MIYFDPATAFKEHLESGGITERIYARQDRPTTGLPDVFIEVDLNGTIRTLSEGATVKSCILLVGIYVKLLSTDAANSLMEDAMLLKFNDMLSRKSAVNGKYHFQISTEMVSRGRDITAGYSYMLLNINTLIY